MNLTSHSDVNHNDNPIPQHRTDLDALLPSNGFLLEHFPDGMLILNGDGVITYVNPAAERLFGKKACELTGTSLGIPIVTGTCSEIPLERNGSLRRAEIRVTEIRQGEAQYLVILRDVTSQQSSINFLLKAGARLSQSLDHDKAREAIAELGVKLLADWCVVDIVDGPEVVRAALAHHEPSQNTLVRSLMRRFHSRDDVPQLICRALDSMRPILITEPTPEDIRDLISSSKLTSIVHHLEHRLVAHLGCTSIMTIPLITHNRALGTVTFVYSKDDRRHSRTEFELAEAFVRRAALALENTRLYSEAQLNIQQRDDFLALLTHELRNPLSPIMHATEMLKLIGPSTEQKKAIFETLSRSVRHLGRLVDDLLDLSRITRGSAELHKSPFLLSDLLTDAVAAARPMIDQRQHQFSISLPQVPIWIEADEVRFTQILVNLLNNAAKYTPPEGQISLTCSWDNKNVAIRIRDNGIGIGRDDLPYIFNLFVQGKQSQARTMGGLGIGLTLVRQLVELHGGTINVCSAGRGQGSEFEVRFPVISPPEKPSAWPELPESLPPLTDSANQSDAKPRIALVDDNQDIRDMLRELLQLGGYEVQVADDGLSGVSLVRQFRPDIALVDIGLPAIDGYEVARRLKADNATSGIPLIALTGYGQPEHCRRIADAGFSEHLVKPVSFGHLNRSIQNQLAVVATAKAESPRPPSSSPGEGSTL